MCVCVCAIGIELPHILLAKYQGQKSLKMMISGLYHSNTVINFIITNSSTIRHYVPPDITNMMYILTLAKNVNLNVIKSLGLPVPRNRIEK